jgi:hypothetical protein
MHSIEPWLAQSAPDQRGRLSEHRYVLEIQEGVHRDQACDPAGHYCRMTEISMS